jgi:hypothetical protein
MRNKYQFIYIVLCAGLWLTACRKGYMDLNENPNQVSNPTLQSLLSTATHKSGINNYNTGLITSTYVQYLANPSAGASSDIYQETDNNSTWDALYFALADIHDMKELARGQGASEYLGVANVLLAYNLNLVTDLWGDAPFSNCFDRTTLTPTYDKQEDLYKAALDMLDSAIVELGITTATLKLQATNDLIHSGSRTKWLQTAYALKARMLNKVSKTSSYNPAAVLAALDNAYKGNADDAAMKGFQLRNPWAQLSRNNEGRTLGGWLSEQLVDHMNGTTYGIFDPRIRKITDTALGNKYVGTVNGAGNKGPGNNTVWDECYVSYRSPWTSDTSSIPLITFAETKFIEAEAALASDATRAYNAYLAGINANMDRLQVPAGTERTDYIAAASVGAANLTKALIFKEKYVALYLNPEAWNDARRFDYQYKDFTMPQNAVLPTFIRRLAYTTGERSKNGKNVPAELRKLHYENLFGTIQTRQRRHKKQSR